MNRKQDHHRAAFAGAGTTQVPFYGVVAPTIYIGEAVASALSSAVKYVFEAIRRGYWERKTRVALSDLDDAILRDIGVARSEIAEVARRSAENPGF